MRRAFIVATLGLALTLSISEALAQLRLEITQSALEAVPIAVVPFGWEGEGDRGPFDVAGLIDSDLGGTGRFEPMKRSNMLDFPTQGRDIDFGDWRLLQTDYLVVGRVIPGEGVDRFVIQYQLFNVHNGEQLLGFRLPSTRSALRASSHRISDQIYEKLTGVRGAFSTRVAYVAANRSENETTYLLIVADADGENRKVIAESSDPIMSPTWSPDGRQLAYVSFEGNRSAIYSQTLATGARRRVSARAGVNGAPDWSPDGRKLALTLSKTDGNLDVYVVELENQVLSRVTTHAAIDTEATWGPDSKSLYFTSDRSGAPQIYRAVVGGATAPKRVTFEGNYNARPRVSPDSRQLAIVHNDRGNYRIALVDLASASTQVLTKGSLDESPSFAPNGSTIIYATRDKGRGVLATVSVDGRVHQRIVAEEGEVREPAWSPFPPES